MYELKKYIKYILAVLFIIFCIVIGFVKGSEIKYNNNVIEIESQRNNIFSDYEFNESLVKSYLNVYEINDESSYQSVKNDLYNNLSLEMQKEIFPTVNYSGLALHDLEWSINRIVGTNNPREELNVFLLEYHLTGVNYNQLITNLVKVKDGIILDVERIK